MKTRTRRHLIRAAIGISVLCAATLVAFPSIASPNSPGNSLLSAGEVGPSARAISSIRIR